MDKKIQLSKSSFLAAIKAGSALKAQACINGQQSLGEVFGANANTLSESIKDNPEFEEAYNNMFRAGKNKKPNVIDWVD